MRNPFQRSHAADDPVEAALRESLIEHARHAPAADVLADRILATVSTRPPARDLRELHAPVRRWRELALPAVAAATVAAVVAIVGTVVAVQHYRSAPRPAAQSSDRTAPTSLPVAPPIPAVSQPGSASTSPPRPLDTSALHDARIVDLTFTAADRGWGLASATCIHGSGRCTALLRTTDGRTWHSRPNTPFNVPGVAGCAAPCVEHLRFADDRIGYAFGPAALYLTTDGARTWQRQGGGADALETLDGNVLRVTSDGSGCPGPCNVRVEAADLGGTRWTTVLGPNVGGGGQALAAAVGLRLSRGGSDAYLLATRNPAGGAGDARSTLYRSRDDGRSWTSAGEPCQSGRAEVDSYTVAAAPGGRVSVLCAARLASQRWFVATSADHGASFTARPGTVPAATAGQLGGDPSTVLVAAGEGLSRSTDGGDTWTTVPGVSGPVGYLGFESDWVGRIVADGGRAIWTTRDAGRTWTRGTVR